MQYQIALDPELNLSVDEFIEAWNTHTNGQDAPAKAVDLPKQNYLTHEMSIILITAAISIPTTIVAELVVELIKKKFIDKQEEPSISVTIVQLSDEQPLWLVKKSE